jgi:hypothetical protein
MRVAAFALLAASACAAPLIKTVNIAGASATVEAEARLDHKILPRDIVSLEDALVEADTEEKALTSNLLELNLLDRDLTLGDVLTDTATAERLLTTNGVS